MSAAKLQVLFAIFASSAIVVLCQNAAGAVMTPNMTLKDGDTLVSPRGVFAFGFFRLEESSKKRYLGIWYHSISVQTIIWVANRVTPVDNSSAVLTLSANGNLILFSNTTDLKVVWSAGTSNATEPVLKILDNGNLVLSSGDGKNVTWQSFDYPTDTIVPEMKIGVDLRANLLRKFTPWTSPTDPSPGEYSYLFETRGVPETFIWKGSKISNRYYGPWGAKTCVETNGIFSITFVWNKSEVYYYPVIDDKSLLGRVTLTSDGVLRGFFWLGNNWSFFGQFPEDKCDNYAICGPNSICNSTVCQCLQGFVPKSSEKWELDEYSDGCLIENASDCSSGRDFIKLPNMKLPDTLNATSSSNKSLEECRLWCSQNCSCTAYAVIGVLGCLTWHGDLIDMRVPRAEGDDIFVLVPASISGSIGSSDKKKFELIIIIISVFGGLLLCISLIIFLKRTKKKQEDIPVNSSFPEEDDLELPIFDMLTIRAATNDFSEHNILGKGGFGPVYKGELDDGREIAIKRLFKGSVQGLNEFKTEALLIAKLQHRNLVRLIGCCIHDDERMLIYEYMPNTSLDAFIFGDKKNKMVLNWQKRIDIIKGIARGLLYLHQDSRLRIIHRDLKPSNVLLDQEMNPKISDFGMARIFGADQIHQHTKKVVGTYGYMAPEYAMDGIFSERSDVYSFGVIILEIISGRKVTFQGENQAFLLAHAWNLWKEGRCTEFFDKLDEPESLLSKLRRCIQIGLLCVQEKSKDRPSMEEVILMLDDESIVLQPPMPPAFCMEPTSSEASDYTFSNDVTITAVEAR